MDTFKVERRTRRTSAHGTARSPEWQRIVRAGIVLQAQAGTISAIEYLKSQGIAGSVIARVLSGGSLRAEDRAVLGLNQA